MAHKRYDVARPTEDAALANIERESGKRARAIKALAFRGPRQVGKGATL